MSRSTARAVSPNWCSSAPCRRLMLKTAANPGGLPIEVFDGLRQQLAANRAQFYREFASGPFYSYNRPGAKVLQSVIDNWWRQAMMGGAKAQYDGIKAFSETDFTEDLKKIDVPTLVMHGDDDQIVPIADSALLSSKLLKKGTLKVHQGFPHGMCTTHADVVNPELLAFIKADLQGSESGRHAVRLGRGTACPTLTPLKARGAGPDHHGVRLRKRRSRTARHLSAQPAPRYQ